MIKDIRQIFTYEHLNLSTINKLFIGNYLMVFFLDAWMEKKHLKSYNRLILKFIMHMNLDLNFIFALKKGYYWPSMVNDCVDFAIRCHAR
jgi:hypothetical protein